MAIWTFGLSFILEYYNLANVKKFWIVVYVPENHMEYLINGV